MKRSFIIASHLNSSCAIVSHTSRRAATILGVYWRRARILALWLGTGAPDLVLSREQGDRASDALSAQRWMPGVACYDK